MGLLSHGLLTVGWACFPLFLSLCGLGRFCWVRFWGRPLSASLCHTGDLPSEKALAVSSFLLLCSSRSWILVSELASQLALIR